MEVRPADETTNVLLKFPAPGPRVDPVQLFTSDRTEISGRGSDLTVMFYTDRAGAKPQTRIPFT